MRHDTIASFRKSRHYDVVTCSTLTRGDGSKICASKLISVQISTLQINSSVWLLCSFKPSPERWLAENIRFPTTLKVNLGTSLLLLNNLSKRKGEIKAFAAACLVGGGLARWWQGPTAGARTWRASCRRCAAMARARRGARRGLLTRSWLLLSSLHPGQRTPELANCFIDECRYQCRQVSSSRLVSSFSKYFEYRCTLLHCIDAIIGKLWWKLIITRHQSTSDQPQIVRQLRHGGETYIFLSTWRKHHHAVVLCCECMSISSIDVLKVLSNPFWPFGCGEESWKQRPIFSPPPGCRLMRRSLEQKVSSSSPEVARCRGHRARSRVSVIIMAHLSH